VPARSFYSPRSGNYIVPQDPIGGPGVVENQLHQLGFLWLGIANDGLNSAWRVSCPVALPHRAWSVAWLGPIALPGTVAVSCM
jgi:hypothetical protein